MSYWRSWHWHLRCYRKWGGRKWRGRKWRGENMMRRVLFGQLWGIQKSWTYRWPLLWLGMAVRVHWRGYMDLWRPAGGRLSVNLPWVVFRKPMWQIFVITWIRGVTIPTSTSWWPFRLSFSLSLLLPLFLFLLSRDRNRNDRLSVGRDNQVGVSMVTLVEHWAYRSVKRLQWIRIGSKNSRAWAKAIRLCWIHIIPPVIGRIGSRISAPGPKRNGSVIRVYPIGIRRNKNFSSLACTAVSRTRIRTGSTAVPF